MSWMEEAVIIEVLGVRVYAFGMSVALGALCGLIALALLGRASRLKPGAVELTGLLSILLGLCCSRLVFCLLNQELGHMMPFETWFQISGGGWSLFGLLTGVFLGGFLAARIVGEKTGRVLDLLSLSVLPVIIAERISENRIEDFDISRPLDSTFLNGTFLVVGEDEPCLATYYVAAAFALALFVFLLCRLRTERAPGDLALVFLLCFGAGSVVTESLRYDRFLSVSFVGLQQILAAVMLGLGVVLAVRRNRRKTPRLAIAALISLPLMVGIVLGLEFALDRTTWNKLLLYAAMIATVATPAVLGLRLLKGAERTEKP